MLRTLGLALLVATSCSKRDGEGSDMPTSGGASASQPADGGADVQAVEVSGSPGAYQLAVTLSSPDTGCDRYADWWEVVTPEGELLHRRILAHSHVDEQPFTRSGGPVDARENDEVIVRAHMSVGGYGGAAMKGRLGDGAFEPTALDADFAAELEESAPLPDGCAF